MFCVNLHLRRRQARLCALVLCLLTLGRTEAFAQASGDRQDVVKGCWFGGSILGCATVIARLWDRGSGRLIDDALQVRGNPPAVASSRPPSTPAPTPRPTPIVFDGTFAVPDAMALYTLRGLVPQVVTTGTCGELRLDRQRLSALLCAATQQLGGAAAQRQWPEEYQLLRSLDQRLTRAGCILAASDPCSRTPVRTDAAVAPAADSAPAIEPLDLVEWSRTLAEAGGELAAHFD